MSSLQLGKLNGPPEEKASGVMHFEAKPDKRLWGGEELMIKEPDRGWKKVRTLR